MTIRKMNQTPVDWPKAPGCSYWARDDNDHLLIIGTQTIGKIMREPGEKPYHVWALNPGMGDATGRFDTFEEAMESLVEHAVEHGTCGEDPQPYEGDRALLAELVRSIRVKSLAIGVLSLWSSGFALAGHFIDQPMLLGAASSTALGAAIMCFVWRAEAAEKGRK
jgi:hypothetical protein